MEFMQAKATWNLNTREKAIKARTKLSKVGHKQKALGKIVETCSAYIFSAPQDSILTILFLKA